MTCKLCPHPIGPRDGVCITWTSNGERVVAHATCHARKHWAAPERPARSTRPSVSDHTLESLTAMVTRTLAVPAMTGETYTQWLSGRCSALVQLLINDWGGSCRNCGALPLRELSDVTEPMSVSR